MSRFLSPLLHTFHQVSSLVSIEQTNTDLHNADLYANTRQLLRLERQLLAVQARMARMQMEKFKAEVPEFKEEGPEVLHWCCTVEPPYGSISKCQISQSVTLVKA